MTIIVKRIPQLPAGAGSQPGWKIAVWDVTTNTTKQVDVSEFINNENTGDYDWKDDFSYSVNEVSFYNNKLWASDINGNLNNVPQAGPNWTEVVEGKSGGIKTWGAGAFTADEVFVVYDPGGGNLMYELTAVARPYNSVDIDAEIIAGDWVPFNTSVTDIVYDGAREIRALPAVGENMQANSILTFLDKAFFPAIVASITQADYPLQEVGFSYIAIVTGTISPNDSTILTRTIRELVADVISANPSGNAVAEPVFAQIMIKGLNQTYRIDASVDTNGGITSEESRESDVFAWFPYFTGFGVAALTGNTLYQALNKLIVAQANQEITLTGTNEKMYICFDADYPDLTSIKDPNGFEILGSVFPASPELRTITSNGLASNYNKSYKVYESVSNTTANGGHIITH